MEILRSNVEDAKRLFLDRLTVGGQPLQNPDPGNIDQGPGVQYNYGGVYDPFDFGVGGDCSGISANVVSAALFGFAQMSWERLFSTETFCDWAPQYGFRQVSQQEFNSRYFPIRVWIEHGGGGPNSHMMCEIDGIQMESNGDYGTCTAGHGGTSKDSGIWNDWWVHDGPIVEDTIWREPMQYHQGVDFAAGRIYAGFLVGAGKQFVCRYVGEDADLQWKVIQADEFQDYMDNDIDVVFNFEAAADGMLGGYSAGLDHARQAVQHIRSLPGLADIDPVVYFSADFDEAPNQDAAIDAYLDACALILGGEQNVGIYGSYYICKRALDGKKAKYAWQTEGWSGSDDGIHIDPRFHIIQRNNLGYVNIGGVQCDLNEAHADDFGQCTGGIMASIASQLLDQVAGPQQADGSRGWPQLAGPDGKPRSLVDATAALVKKEGV